MTSLPVLDHASLSGIADLCRRGIPNPPSIEELEGALFAPAQPAVIRGNPNVAVVATVEGDNGAHIRLIVVDPEARGQGHGHALVRAAHEDARALGHRTVTVGADAPYHLWPGAPIDSTALLCLLERHRYQRVETNFDMTIDLAAIPDDPGGPVIATSADRVEIEQWSATHWQQWRAEVLRALEKGNLAVARDDAGISAICAFEVNRAGVLGPVASRPDLIGKGAGRRALLGALHELRRRGRESIDVAWVGPIGPYAALGGRVTNVYFVYRRELS